jgi:hypothetical protein
MPYLLDEQPRPTSTRQTAMRLSIALLATVATLALSSGAQAQTTTEPARRGGGNSISNEELQHTTASDLFTAVQSLRPQWLRRNHSSTIRGGDGISVYRDGVRLGGVAELRQMAATDAATVTYLSPSQAQARYGLGNLNGAIVVTSAGYNP